MPQLTMEAVQRDLVERLTAARAGDPRARQQLWDDYAPVLEVIARRSARRELSESSAPERLPMRPVPVEARVTRLMRRLMDAFGASPARPETFRRGPADSRPTVAC